MGFINKENGQQPPQRQLLENRFRSARYNILLVLIFTAVNILLAVTQSNLYFLFSAYIPYALVDLGMLLCGMYPEEFYEAFYGAPYHSLEFSSKVIFVIALAVAVVILVWYLMSWLFTKKVKLGWMIFAFAFFVVDTLAMLIIGGISLDMLIDYVFHAWVLFSLLNGILAGRKLKKLPEEVVDAVAAEPVE